MSISGVGYSQTYYYNTETKKVSSKNGGQDDIVDYLNGESAFNKPGFDSADERQKNVIKNFLMMQNNNPYGSFKNYEFPGEQDYNPALNSAAITPGDVFKLKNGYSLEVTKDGVMVMERKSGKGTPEDAAYAQEMANRLDGFIRSANRGCLGLSISDDRTQDLLDVIGQTGVDLSKEFTINGTKFKEKDNEIKIMDAFGEGGKVWEREEKWRREEFRQFLKEELGVTDKEFEDMADAATIPKNTGAPYSNLADENGMINYNGIIFTCDNQKKTLNLGYIPADMKNVIRIPLSDGGCLLVNRDNLGDLSKAIGMFSPEDVNLIMRAIRLDTKIQEMEKEIADMEEGIGKSNKESFEGTEESVKEAWKNAEKSTGYDGYLGDSDAGMVYLSQFETKLLTGDIEGMEGFMTVFGPTRQTAMDFASEAIGNLEEMIKGEKDKKMKGFREREKEFYEKFLAGLET